MEPRRVRVPKARALPKAVTVRLRRAPIGVDTWSLTRTRRHLSYGQNSLCMAYNSFNKDPRQSPCIHIISTRKCSAWLLSFRSALPLRPVPFRSLFGLLAVQLKVGDFHPAPPNWPFRHSKQHLMETLGP